MKCQPTGKRDSAPAKVYTAQVVDDASWVEVYAFEDSAKMLEKYDLMRAYPKGWVVMNQPRGIVVAGGTATQDVGRKAITTAVQGM